MKTSGEKTPSPAASPDHNIHAEEIALAQEQLQHTTIAITQARIRLDSLRLIVEGPGEMA